MTCWTAPSSTSYCYTTLLRSLYWWVLQISKLYFGRPTFCSVESARKLLTSHELDKKPKNIDFHIMCICSYYSHIHRPTSWKAAKANKVGSLHIIVLIALLDTKNVPISNLLKSRALLVSPDYLCYCKCLEDGPMKYEILGPMIHYITFDETKKYALRSNVNIYQNWYEFLNCGSGIADSNVAFVVTSLLQKACWIQPQSESPIWCDFGWRSGSSCFMPMTPFDHCAIWRGCWGASASAANKFASFLFQTTLQEACVNSASQI